MNLINKIISLVIVVFLSCFTVVYAKDKKSLRVISLAPSTTEILFALGLDKEIVGVSSFCDYPPGALTKKKVGSFSKPDMEKIISLKPDIIFCTGLEQAFAVKELKNMNLNTCVSDPSTIQELLDSIEKIGSLVSKEKQAQQLIENLKSKITEIENRVITIPDNEKTTVFIEIYHDPLMTAGNGSYINDVLTHAGGINIASDTKRPYSYFSPETVIQRDPECIILLYMNENNATETVRERTGWAGISAVRNKRVYNDINPDTLLRPGPRVAEGIEKLHKKLYP